jgi:tRNA/tmRNA/rRNA uracil-C5-methylase (TrmA/RlmC/RlmD family)
VDPTYCYWVTFIDLGSEALCGAVGEEEWMEAQTAKSAELSCGAGSIPVVLTDKVVLIVGLDLAQVSRQHGTGGAEALPVSRATLVIVLIEIRYV